MTHLLRNYCADYEQGASRPFNPLLFFFPPLQIFDLKRLGGFSLSSETLDLSITKEIKSMVERCRNHIKKRDRLRPIPLILTTYKLNSDIYLCLRTFVITIDVCQLVFR